MKNKVCTGYDRFVKNAKNLYPETLYHTTTKLDRVCYEGLKTIDELDEMSVGIGGGHSKIISFTYDENLAIDYAQDMKTLSKISNNILNPQNICEYLNVLIYIVNEKLINKFQVVLYI